MGWPQQTLQQPPLQESEEKGVVPEVAYTGENWQEEEAKPQRQPLLTKQIFRKHFYKMQSFQKIIMPDRM